MSPLDRSSSFSRRVKDELLTLEIKKKCCKRAFDDALSLRSAPSDIAGRIEREKMICDKCASRFAAGLFVSFGNVTDPDKAHHLEFSLADAGSRDALCKFLCDLGFPPAKAQRKGRYLAYYKRIDTIVDFLGTVGANNSMFVYLNSRIIGSIRNDTNRRVNFDSANIKRSLNATKNQLDVIRLIIENGMFNELSPELQEAANLRLEFPEATLAELGLKFQYPISKSGVNHRLEKIGDFAKKKELI